MEFELGGKTMATNVVGDIIKNIFPDENLAEEMALMFNGNTNIDEFIEFSRLQEQASVFIVNQKIKSLEGMQHFINIDTLMILSNELSDLVPLENLINLKNLSFDHSQVSDLTPLENLANLKHLFFNYSRVSDLTPLQNLTSLETLTFLHCKVGDVTPLENLTNLIILYGGYNCISDLTPLRRMNLDVGSFSNQTIDFDEVGVGQVTLLNIFDVDGNFPSFTVPSGGHIISDNNLVWHSPGNYTVKWTSENHGIEFSGTISQHVIESS